MLKTAIILTIMILSKPGIKEDHKIKIDPIIPQNVIPYRGWSSAYVEETTIGTYNYRLSIGDIEPGYDSYIAVNDCGRISETGIMIINDSVRTYQVFDCARRDNSDGTRTWMEESNILAEIDFYTWQDHPDLGRIELYPN